MERKNSLDKALDVLFCFKGSNHLLSVQGISDILSIPKSSAYRYISKLREKGLLQIDTSSKKYKLGMKLFELGGIVYKQMGIREIILPFMKQLYEVTGESVFLTILDEDQVVCIEKIESNAMLRISLERGDVMPFHAVASAKILMAYLAENEQDEVIRKKGLPKMTSCTITDPHRLKHHLKEIRRRGVCLQ